MYKMGHERHNDKYADVQKTANISPFSPDIIAYLQGKVNDYYIIALERCIPVKPSQI